MPGQTAGGGAWRRPGRGAGADQLFQQVAIDDSAAATRAPLAVLVDGQSASAAEILAGAALLRRCTLALLNHISYSCCMRWYVLSWTSCCRHLVPVSSFYGVEDF